MEDKGTASPLSRSQQWFQTAKRLNYRSSFTLEKVKTLWFFIMFKETTGSEKPCPRWYMKGINNGTVSKNIVVKWGSKVARVCLTALVLILAVLGILVKSIGQFALSMGCYAIGGIGRLFEGRSPAIDPKDLLSSKSNKKAK